LQDIDGRPTKLDKYKGKVVLVVNLASACGFTPQYAELQELYQKYSSKGLVVLGFPVSAAAAAPCVETHVNEAGLLQPTAPVQLCS
jgi:glutathione peroxidase